MRRGGEAEEEWVTKKKVEITTTKNVEKKIQRQVVLEVIYHKCLYIHQHTSSTFCSWKKLKNAAAKLIWKWQNKLKVKVIFLPR